MVFSVSWVTSLRRPWSIAAYYYSVVFSLVFSSQRGSESVAFSASSVSVALSWCVLFSGSFSVCALQCLQCSEHWLFTKSLSCQSCHVLSPHSGMSSAPAQFLNFNIPSTTESPKLQCKNYIFKNPLIYQCTMTHFGTYLFFVGTHWGNLLVSSRFSTGDLNFCIHSIPLWEPCVEKLIMLRASMHRPVGRAL